MLVRRIELWFRNFNKTGEVKMLQVRAAFHRAGLGAAGLQCPVASLCFQAADNASTGTHFTRNCR